MRRYRKITPKMSKLDCWNDGYAIGWHERHRRPADRYWLLFCFVVGVALGVLL